MPFVMSARSLKNLQGVHEDLWKVAHRALSLSPVDFAVIEGLRTRARQAQLMAAGASQKMDSAHLIGHAIDVAALLAGSVEWKTALYLPIGEAFHEAARQLDIPIIWGGDWPHFKDYGHFELAQRPTTVTA